MSGDNGRRGHGPQQNKPVQVITPQPVSDKSIIDSVAGIINDIVPQAYTSSGSNSDNREPIIWAKFEWTDINDPSLFPESSNVGSTTIPPLLLVLGYTNGAQIWLVSASGEASEVLTWRSGPVRSLRLLPNPRQHRGKSGVVIQEHEEEEDAGDLYRDKRPLVAICDASGPQPHCNAVTFVSLRSGEIVKSIRFRSAVNEVLANKRSIIVTFSERIAVFDARTFEDVLSVTTCYHNLGSSLNPVALGSRWMAYCERRLIPAKRSSGGCETEGVSSYTATVLYAAKSLGKGLRGLGETVASSFSGGVGSGAASLNHANSHAGNTSSLPANSAQNHNNCNANETPQPGVVSVLDLEAPDGHPNQLIAHFTAHSEAVVAMCFDHSGAMLMTADRRGHDFHVFRLQPHPDGSSLAAVHHLYVLHRGDTSAKVQDMVFSGDGRWAAVSTSRGTSHVFPVAPFGGPLGVRTHCSPHVVNRLSRFHESAGFGDDVATRSHSPVAHAHDGPYVGVAAGLSCSPAYSSSFSQALQPYSNPRLPPYPHPTIVHPLAQIRQPSSLSYASSQAQARQQPRQRLNSDDSGVGQIRLCACFAPPRAWINAQRDAPVYKLVKRPVDSLFIMACHGNLIQYDLEPKPSSGMPKEKVCDETPIELEVEAKGQWPLTRFAVSDVGVPLSQDSPLLEAPPGRNFDEDKYIKQGYWLSEVEIENYAGPHRRLWMGPQFVFKTYTAPSGVAANLVEAETVEISTTTGSRRPARSNPVNMPHAAGRQLMPVVIDGSGSYEQSPRFLGTCGDSSDRCDNSDQRCELQLREDLADAMLEASTNLHQSTGRRLVVERVGGPVAKVVNPLGTVIRVPAEHEDTTATTFRQHQQRASRKSNIHNGNNANGSNSSKKESVYAEKGKWSGSVCSFEDQLITESVHEHTEICAEMRPAREVAVIDSVPPESIEEVRESRTLCAEAIDSFGTSELVIESAREVRPESPSPLCAEAGLVDCHAWSCLLSNSDTSQSPPLQAISSSDEDIEHVMLANCTEHEEKKPSQAEITTTDAIEILEAEPERSRQRDSEPDLPDMVEIINIDTMPGDGEPPKDSIKVVLGPAKPAHTKSKRHKTKVKAQQQQHRQPSPTPTSNVVERNTDEPPTSWGTLLEANKENLEEDESTNEKFEKASTTMECLSSSDEDKPTLLALPMDTEEENNSACRDKTVVEPEIKKDDCKPVEQIEQIEQIVGSGETLDTPPPPLSSLPSTGATNKKANRSKKKKRR